MGTVSTFGRILAEQRKKRGMSRSQLASATELSYPYVSQLETGLRKPSRDAAARLSKALGLDLHVLETAIPTNESEAEINRANLQSERILSSLTSDEPTHLPAAAMMVGPLTGRGPIVDRDDLVGQLVDLLEEFPADERLDVLGDLQKRTMQRLLDQKVPPSA